MKRLTLTACAFSCLPLLYYSPCEDIHVLQMMYGTILLLIVVGTHVYLSLFTNVYVHLQRMLSCEYATI